MSLGMELHTKFVGGQESLVMPKNIQTEITKEAHEKGNTGVRNTEKVLRKTKR